MFYRHTGNIIRQANLKIGLLVIEKVNFNSMNKKVGKYLFIGFLLLYYALKDDDFIVMYNGIAIVVAIISFYLAYSEYKKANES